MIHIATVHWRDPRWIDIQHRYFQAHLGEEYRVYAYLNGIENVSAHRAKFFYSSTEAIELHEIKLNVLADIISAHSRCDDDILIFIDGDAFPIGNIASVAHRALADFPLLAVQRLENNGDIQPHPCFCVTTVGFWKRLGGDWKRGYQWRNAQGELVTDVGGNLLQQLEQRAIRWLPLRRSNRVNLHPVWFGVYHDLVYHHGAAFREHPWSRLDLRNIADMSTLPLFKRLQTKVIRRLIRHFKLHQLEKYCPAGQRHDAMVERNRQLGAEMFCVIEQDARFYERLIGPGPRIWESTLNGASSPQAISSE
jgi:hypothetical protein